MTYKALYDSPTVEKYRFLRETCGLFPKSEKAATIALKNSLCSVVVLDTDSKNEVIGMGRLVGDGGVPLPNCRYLCITRASKEGVRKAYHDDAK